MGADIFQGMPCTGFKAQDPLYIRVRTVTHLQRNLGCAQPVRSLADPPAVRRGDRAVGAVPAPAQTRSRGRQLGRAATCGTRQTGDESVAFAACVLPLKDASTFRPGQVN